MKRASSRGMPGRKPDRMPLHPQKSIKPLLIYPFSAVLLLLSAVFITLILWPKSNQNASTAWLSEIFPSLSGPARTEAALPKDHLPVFLGLYTSDSLQITYWELQHFDQWLAANDMDKRVTLAGTFMDIEFHNPDWNVARELDAAWENGYTPYVNLTAYQRSAMDVATDPEVEQRIRLWAAAYAAWANDGEKRAFIAPLQEMNGGWVRYGLDPQGFKLAFYKIQQIFAEEGVPANAVAWVFAPNGWSEAGHEFEVYYPGDDLVDAIAFSTLNFGFCPNYIGNWDGYDLIFRPYLERLQAMAPGKPIFISQTGTVNVGPEGPDDELKNEWLYDSFTRLAAFPGVRGILYYNLMKAELNIENCRPVDWRIYDRYNEIAYTGFLDAFSSPVFGHWEKDSVEMREIAFGESLPASFADTFPPHPLSGVSEIWYHPWVETLAMLRIAPGCRADHYPHGDQILNQNFFCPNMAVTRADAAHFLVLAQRGPDSIPPAAQGLYDDVPPDYWAATWIEQLALSVQLPPCQSGQFCPEEPITRAEAAYLLVHSAPGQHLPASGNPSIVFDDVRSSDITAAAIGQMVGSGIMVACRPGHFCANEPVSRAEWARMLVLTFELQQVQDISWLQ